jgi:hypothetical protein
MGTLRFECPITGHPVTSGIEVDQISFVSLSRETTYLYCPHCPEPHLLGDVVAWTYDEVPKAETPLQPPT